MKITTMRIIGDWLNHATYGVSALLPAVPRETPDTRPEAVCVLTAADDQGAALDQVPKESPQLPALVVTLYPSPMEQSIPANRPWPPDVQVDVLIRYASRDALTDRGVRDESITMRAVWRSLGQIMVTERGMTARTRNQVQLLGIESMRGLTLDRPYQDAIMTGAVLVTVRVRDLYACGD